MVISGHPEAIEDGFVEVGFPVPVGICDPCEFGSLHDQKA